MYQFRVSVLLSLSSALCSAAAPASQNAVATVNGEAISPAQLESVLRPQLEAVEERIRQMRLGMLNKLIDNLLLEQAARAEGLPVDRFLESRVESVSVSAAEVDRAYENSRENFRGILAAEAKYRIRRTLEDNARAAALTALLEKLRSTAQVTNHLMAGISATLEAAGREGPALGPDDAPVTIVEFSDFECPYCRAAQPFLQRLRERWPGKIRHVFKHFPLEQHPGAMPSARAAVCADRQGAFWRFHDRIFNAQGSLSESVLRAAAAESGANLSEFEACMRSPQPEDHVRKDMLVGRMAGVTGTPAFFVNAQPAPDAAGLEAAIARILGESK